MDLAVWLESIGRFEEGNDVSRFGIQPGGDTDEPWRQA
jgi:hypothetical protein